MKSLLTAVAALVASSSAVAVDPTVLLFDFNSGSAGPSFVDPKLENVGPWQPLSGMLATSILIPTDPSAPDGIFFFDIADGYELDLSSISFNHSKVKIPDTRGGLGNVRFSIELNSNTLASNINSTGSSSLYEFTNASLISGITGAGNSFSFNFSDGSDNTAIELDNFQFLGTISAVPEPTTVFGLAAAGFASVYFARRRKKMALQAS